MHTFDQKSDTLPNLGSFGCPVMCKLKIVAHSKLLNF
uniref:Uncharacterized protein n=1 Tax=Tetranychus urticae TaxID=32264 RepID=T1KKA5_TETUR